MAAWAADTKSRGVAAINAKIASFLMSEPTAWGSYAYVALRLVVAAFWINSDVPRWAAVAAGHPAGNGMVRSLFGPNMVIPLTYFFTTLETLGAVALILGFATRLPAVWGIIEFAITGTSGVLAGNIGLAKDLGLLAASLVLLANGSPKLSLDGVIAKRKSIK